MTVANERVNLRRIGVLGGFGLALALFAIGTLSPATVRPRAAAVFVHDRRVALVATGIVLLAVAALISR